MKNSSVNQRSCGRQFRFYACAIISTNSAMLRGNFVILRGFCVRMTFACRITGRFDCDNRELDFREFFFPFTAFAFPLF
jgi:hypothetical protein